MNKFRGIWTISTNLEQFWPIWTNLDQFGKILTTFLQVYINFYKFRPIMKKKYQLRALLTPQGGSKLKIG
jgi:hypothetical protein